jgi:acetoacetyl-CoA synthetase
MEPLWTPTSDRVARSNMTDFQFWLERRTGSIFSDYSALHRFSCEDIGRFWDLFVEYTGIISHAPYSAVLTDPSMPGARWFEGMMLNYAENILERGHGGPAIIYRVEPRADSKSEPVHSGGTISFAELKALVARCARGLRSAGVVKGDRVAGYIANVPEAIVASLACASIGATWSSASPDFGLQAVVDRFGQVKPKVIFASTHYQYKGRQFETGDVVGQLKRIIASVETIVSVPYPLGKVTVTGDIGWHAFLGKDDNPDLPYEPVNFAHPLYIMFSSGTTGAPKCMVHGTGGTLLTHRKEHQLHCDIRPFDRLLYFTTCGWMMWNWQLSALSLGATLVSYDGNPAYPEPSTLWKVVNETRTTHFGTSGRHIESSMKGLGPDELADLNNLPHTRSILYTGSPLSEIGYRWIYDSIKPDVHLAGISGGTDILSCFVLGSPTLPVYPGEIQCKGLGVDVHAFDDQGDSLSNEPGELVCTQPLPCMPVSFLDDPDGIRYHDAYFDYFPGIWRHGDFVSFSERGGAIIHGRSDATLNPGGVRIGSAELYAVLDEIAFVKGSVAVGFTPPDQSDELIVLLVAISKGMELSDGQVTQLKSAIRDKCSPRHVPRHVFQISDIPVTRSGKTVELSVKAILHGREVKNRNALANPEVLEEIGPLREALIAAYST